MLQFVNIYVIIYQRGVLMNKEFDRVYQIMDESFPDEEMRTYEGQLALLDEDDYHLICKRNKDGKIVAFMTLWEIEAFSFIEHLATSKESRGSGIGSKLLKEYMDSCKKPIILEVDPGITEISKRRIKFYERLGFHLSPFTYFQPKLRKGAEECVLQLMSYPYPLSKETFVECKDILFNNIYSLDKKNLENE